MTGQETTRKLSPGDLWLSLDEAAQLAFVDGLIQGLNQGLRHCATETVFSLSTRITDTVSPQNKLVIESLIQQLRTWSKSGYSLFKYSKPRSDYVEELTAFYRMYAKYSNLEPAYLLVYMDDQHAMTAEAIYRLHEHSLHGFKM